MQETRSTCPYCGVGCGVLIESDGARITGVRGDPAHPANHGRLCTKGSTLHLTASPALAQQTRLLQPALRATRGAAPQDVGWDAALDLAAGRLASIVQEHGPDAVGLYVSGQLLTEDYYVFNKLAKGLIGTNNIDTNSRLCMSSAVAGYKLTLGADAPPACYEDVDHADCLFIAGSNAAWAHPVLTRRIEQARAARPQMKIIVADPRRTDTAGMADLFLPLRPGSDTLLFHGMLHIMELEGWLDQAYIARHTSGFADLQALVREATPERVGELCGLPRHDLFQAAQWFALGGDARDGAARGATLSLYCQGLNQSSNGTAKNAALIGLHLATGQIGRVGAGPFSLTGQPNAMGGREVGGAGQSAVGPPRPGQPGPPRRSGRTVGRGRRAAPPRQDRRGDVRGRRRGRDPRAVDSLHQPCAKHARPGPGAARAAAGRIRHRAGGLCHHRHLRLRRPAAACHHLGREDRHGDQQRKAHLARAPRRGRTRRRAP